MAPWTLCTWILPVMVGVTCHLASYAVWANATPLIGGSLQGEQCRPVEVRRSRTGHSTVTFTLWYRITVGTSDVSVTWLQASGSGQAVYIDESTEHVDGNLWKSSFDTNKPNGTVIQVVFRCPQIRHILHLTVAEENRTEDDVIPFQDFMEHPREIVYIRGTDTEFEIRVLQPIESLTLTSRLYSPVTHQMMSAQEISWETWPISISYRNRDNRPMIKRFQVDSSLFSTSGLIDVDFRSSRSPGNLIERVEVRKQLILRPRNQANAFPDGFLGFDMHGLTPDIQAQYHMQCRNSDRSCDVYCDTYGNNLSRVQLYKSRAGLFNGNQVPVRNRIPSGNRYFRSISTSGKPDNLQVEETRFTCIATDQSGATRNVTVVVHYQVNVAIASALRLQYFSNSRVKVTCRVQGRPRPNITFALRFDNDYRLVQPTSVSNWASSYETVAYVMTSVYADPEGEEDRLREVTCSADVTTGSHRAHDHRSVAVPERTRRRYWR